MEFNWLDAGLIVLVVIAIVNRIKAEAPNIKSAYYILISFGVGAAIYSIGLFAPDIVKQIVLIGLAASGIYDEFKKNYRWAIYITFYGSR